MGTNSFDLLVDVDNDDPSLIIAAAEKKAAASPKLAPTAPAAQAKLPTKPLPPAQAARESRNYGAPPRDGSDGAVRGRGGFRGGRTGPRREFGDDDTNGVEGGYCGVGFGDGGVVRREDGEWKASERGHGPHQPYRGSGRRGGYTGGEAGDESGRTPHRAYERRSGTGRGYGMKREGAGRGNWGSVTDEALAQEAVNTE